MRHIAVVGAGFAGLASAHSLIKNFSCKVTIFAKAGPFGGASSMATGLLHPFLGPFAKLALSGKEAYKEALDLINEVEESLNITCCRRDGIFRPALFPRQERSFKKEASRNEEIEWIEDPKHLPSSPGILIKSGLSVFSHIYLDSLWKLCQNLGVETYIKEIKNTKELSCFDSVIWALGSDTTSLEHLAHLPLNKIKGQTLKMEWPEGKAQPPWGIIARKYLLMEKERLSCIIGSSYEENFSNELPDPQKALEAILPSTVSLDPDISNFKLLECKSGIRMHGLNKSTPFLKRLDEKNWVYTGLGSRGLLYHAYCAKRLTYAIFNNLESALPFQDMESI